MFNIFHYTIQRIAPLGVLFIPIIFITALDGENHMVKGLNIGADDYIVKPLSMKTVKARGNAVLRRVYPHGIRDGISAKTICYEGIVLDLKAKTVSLDLKDIDKQQGHPSIKGMKEIAKQVTDYLKRK